MIVKGVSRGWFDQTGGPSWNPIYLGALLERDALCKGVIFRVSAESLAAYNEREVGYQPTKIDRSQITTLAGSQAMPEGEVCFLD